ncbi:MAG: ribosome small subunit-dependent GTPase A [Mollicutes bacterium]|jgi:ribosome biogenesis GTPase|nr:ribosome small subunit-dependent GTPase A [Mollicutes bacterium]
MEGTIVKQISNLYTVEANNKLYECRARGKFYHDKLTPLVGDKVIIDDKNNYILELKPRKNYLDRPSIANIDACLIITSVKSPNLDLNLLDKLLCVIIHNKIKPIICFTKIDLLNRNEKKEIKKLIKYYQKIGIQTFSNKEVRKITKSIANQIIVLTGQTGAGKSTLLNRLNKELNLATSPISEALGRGVHTTRHVELFKYKTSLIADTPGFSAIDIDSLTKEEIKNTFPEFKVKCEYDDCMHIKEPNCVVRKLTEEKKILESRYQSYLKFVR